MKVIQLGINMTREYIIINEPAHDKPYNKTCPTDKASESPAHPHSLISVFANRKDHLQLQAIQR